MMMCLYYSNIESREVDARVRKSQDSERYVCTLKHDIIANVENEKVLARNCKTHEHELVSRSDGILVLKIDWLVSSALCVRDCTW